MPDVWEQAAKDYKPTGAPPQAGNVAAGDPWEQAAKEYRPAKGNGGASDDWSTGFQKFSRALTEANPLSMEQLPSDAERKRRAGLPLGQDLMEQLAPLNPMNMVRSIVQPFQELSEGKTAEGAGHLIGGITAPGGPAKSMAPIARTGLKVAASEPVSTAVGTGVGAMLGHSTPAAIVGGTVGRGVSSLARRGLEALGPPEPRMPVLDRGPSTKWAGAGPAQTAPPAVEPIRGPLPSGRPLPRLETPPAPAAHASIGPRVVPSMLPKGPAWQDVKPSQAPPAEFKPIAGALPSGRIPGKPQPGFNSITSPEIAERGPQISPPEAINRSRLAQDMAEKMHAKGISHADASGMTPQQWQMAQAGARPGSSRTPSPATQQLTLEHLKLLEEKAIGGSKLTGHSLDIAKQLKETMQ